MEKVRKCTWHWSSSQLSVWTISAAGVVHELPLPADLNFKVPFNLSHSVSRIIVWFLWFLATSRGVSLSLFLNDKSAFPSISSLKCQIFYTMKKKQINHSEFESYQYISLLKIQSFILPTMTDNLRRNKWCTDTNMVKCALRMHK